ncbi:hypothetical protein HMP0015_0352 [Acinetobacter haemolyticus ATCC 19194]|uniref:Uncharacterized protein n=1 Tax=Acinetobacter haemolyticus ATCC 19194 TaxID=707232 RepID=D4XKW0_ACIHA|nr:hypothetical protein HMP0015_0352 [Acinetobacter haemolyticus ATCC 19194]
MIEQYPFLFIFTVIYTKKYNHSSPIQTRLIIFQLNFPTLFKFII